MTKEYDLVILGGGTGGYVAAIRASQLGMRVAVVEKEKLGGTCLHHGCIPSKALLRTAELYRQMKNAKEFGIESSGLELHFSEAQKRKNKIIDTMHQGIKALMKKANVDIYNGFGRILGPSIFSPIPGTISIEHENGEENTMIVPKYVLIATGSSPKSIPGLIVDGEQILHSDHALQLDELPESMIIVGGGIIGIEWASLLNDLGVEVTIIESEKSILSSEDRDVRKEVAKSLKKRGVNIVEGAALLPEEVKSGANNVEAAVEIDGQITHLKADKILVSVGREANIHEIGLDNSSIETRNGSIVVNEMHQTKESHIYAIGDCVGGMQLAHVASAEGVVAVEHMAGKNPEPINPLHVPSCIYSYPEAGRVGLTEEEAKKQGYSVKVGMFPFQGIGKAHIKGEPRGVAKMIIDQATEDILGIHIVGPHATEMISEAGLAKILDATAWEISKTIHPHPSLSEVLPEAALAVDGLQIHR